MTKTGQAIIGHKIVSSKVLRQWALLRRVLVGLLENGKLRYWHLNLQGKFLLASLILITSFKAKVLDGEAEGIL
jgi:hypothetical protein